MTKQTENEICICGHKENYHNKFGNPECFMSLTKGMGKAVSCPCKRFIPKEKSND